MLFSKLIFLHKPVAEGIYDLLFMQYGWSLYPKVLSLFPGLAPPQLYKPEPPLRSQIVHKHIE